MAWRRSQIEARRVREFGFTAAELDRAKQSLAGRLRARVQRARQERERPVRPGVRGTSSPTKPSPGIAYEYRPRAAGARRASRSTRSPTIARARLTATSRSHAGRVAAEGRAFSVPTEADLRAALASADTVAVTAVDRQPRSPRAAGEQARRRRPSPRAARSRRSASRVVHLRQRRRGVAEADRFQERSGALHHVRPGRRVAGAARRLRQSVVRRRSTSGSPGSAASRRSTSTSCSPASSARRRRSSRISTHGIQRIRGAGGSRNRAAAALPGLHGARRRPRRV